MNAVRRRRGDFARATLSVLVDDDAAAFLSAKAGERLCATAASACGATYSGLFVLNGYGRPDAAVCCLAHSGCIEGDASFAQERVTADLLGRALAQGGMLAKGDLLIGALAPPAANRDDERGDAPVRFLVLQSTPSRIEGKKRIQAFTEVDRRRLLVLTTLVALKSEAAHVGASSDVLVRVNHALAEEPTVEGKLRRVAAFLAEVTHSDHALIWNRPHVQSAEMRLRTVYGVAEEKSAEVYQRGASNRAIQADLAGMARLEYPAAIATSAIPWLSEILDIGADDIGPAAIVTPIRRGKQVVGIAICSSTRASEDERAAAALEKRALLTALADQIALTTEYVRTAMSAQQNARRFALLAAIGEISLAKMGMGEMLDAILARVQDHFDGSSVTLQLLGSDRSSVRTRSVHGKTALPPSHRCDARVPLVSGTQTLGTLQVRRPAANPFADEDYETLMQVAEQIALALATSGRYEIQAALAVLDALTGLPNRRSADEALDRELEDAQRAGTVFNLALLDIDHFKSINDMYGHDAGDTVLREVARMFRAHLRATDFVARYGGEEFLIILSGGDRAAARQVCERLRHAVSLLNVRGAGGDVIPVSASLGGATFPLDGPARAELFQQADTSLYKAKQAGRNRLWWAGDNE